MSYFLDHEVDFFKSCRSVTVTLEGKNDPVVKTLQNKITRLHLRRHPCKNQTKIKFLWQGSKIQIVSIFAHKQILVRQERLCIFVPQTCFYFHPPESMDRVITGRKLNTFARFAFQRYYIKGNLSNVCSFIDSSSSEKCKLCRNQLGRSFQQCGKSNVLSSVTKKCR